MVDELVVDNFAGGGGASVGMEWAIGRPVDLAINHSAEALAVHAANHPKTVHLQEDIWEVDPVEATGGRSVGLAWFSPDCKHFSRAKGAKPVDRGIRGLAWVAVRWARKVRPRVIILENVEEFLTWGPLGKDDLSSKAHRGQTFDAWKGELEALGYEVDYRSLRACDFGAPTIRKRLFLIARCDGRPIVWPEPTHGDPKDEETVGPGLLLPYRTAAEIIDWSLPCPSIFERKRPLVKNTLRRIENGIRRYVIEASDPFIVAYYGPKKGDAEFRGQGIWEPLRTQTAENRFGLVAPFLAGAGGSAYAGKPVRLDRPSNVVLPEDRRGLVAAFMAKHYGGMVGVDVRQPAPTNTARATQNQVVAATIVKQNFGPKPCHGVGEPLHAVTTQRNKFGLAAAHLEVMRNHAEGQAVSEPLPTLTAHGLHMAEVRAFLTKYYSGGDPAGQSVRDPLHTATDRARFGLIKVAGVDYQIMDIGMRMLTARELFGAQGFLDDYVIDPSYRGKPLTKTAQIRLCGNSVCPAVPAALVRANLPEFCVEEGAA